MFAKKRGVIGVTSTFNRVAAGSNPARSLSWIGSSGVEHHVLRRFPRSLKTNKDLKRGAVGVTSNCTNIACPTCFVREQA